MANKAIISSSLSMLDNNFRSIAPCNTTDTGILLMVSTCGPYAVDTVEARSISSFNLVGVGRGVGAADRFDDGTPLVFSSDGLALSDDAAPPHAGPSTFKLSARVGSLAVPHPSLAPRRPRVLNCVVGCAFAGVPFPEF